jgi:hypothetical protein
MTTQDWPLRWGARPLGPVGDHLVDPTDLADGPVTTTSHRSPGACERAESHRADIVVRLVREVARRRAVSTERHHWRWN